MVTSLHQSANLHLLLYYITFKCIYLAETFIQIDYKWGQWKQTKSTKEQQQTSAETRLS